METTTHTIRRNPLFDVVKALMMLWVVWGHFSRWDVVSGPLEPAPFMENAKIVLNMPVFFAIGGYLALSTFQNGSWPKIASRAIGFLWPIAAFGVIFALCLVATNGWNGWRWLVRFPILRLLHGHWFLRTYAAVYLLSAIIYRLFRHDATRLFGFAILYGTMLFWPAQLRGWLFWIGGTPTIHMFPFFVVGLILFRRFPLWKSNWIAMSCALFFLVVVLFVRDFNGAGLNFWTAPAHWRTVFANIKNLTAMAGRIALGVSGTVAVLWCLDHLLRCFPRLSSLSVFGTTTLGVYVLHEWPLIQLGESEIACLPLPCWTRWPLALVWFVVCHFIVVGIRRLPALRLFFFGEESMLCRIFERAFFSRKLATSSTQ